MAKYHYYRYFARNRAIRKHLPATAICTLGQLTSYLSKYKTVYVKPDVGGRGEGVIKVWNEGEKYGYIVEKGEPVYCSSVPELYDRIGLARKKRHVVQQAIQFAKYRNRPFDVRIMMIRNPQREWKYTGMLAKVAGTRSIITNVNRGGGYAVEIDSALRSFPVVRRSSIRRSMIRLAYRCNWIFDRIRYEWQMGYDMGVDRNGKVWLIEANPGNPSHALFAKLNNKSMYRAIKRAVRAYRKGM